MEDLCQEKFQTWKERNKLSGFFSCSLRAVSLFCSKIRGEECEFAAKSRKTVSSRLRFAGIGRPPTPALLSACSSDRSIAVRLCSLVFALAPRYLRAKERRTARSVRQLGRNLARGQWFESKGLEEKKNHT